MRRLPSGLDHSERSGRLIRTATLVLTAAMALSIGSTPAWAQATKKAATAPTPLDPRPLSRFVPRDNLLVLVEFQGLDLQSDAWTKTAAYKMLNETTLGEMLEAMTAQLADRALANLATKKMSGTDLVAVAKHAMKSGFIFGINPQSNDFAYGTIVIRNGASKEGKATFSRLLGQMMGASKPQIVKKAGRSMIALPMANGKDTWTWWAEQNDLVIAIGKGTEDVVAATIDGTSPNATENAVRAELSKADGGFTPAAFMFIDPKGFPSDRAADTTSKAMTQLTSMGLSRLDYRWGFQDDALMSVLRLKAPKPRKGLLALLDQPSIEKTKLPPLPTGLESFTVLALEPGKILDSFLASAPAASKTSVTEMLDSLKSKSRIDVRKDLLAHIGPKIAFYTMPSTAAKTSGDATKDAPPAGGSALAGLLGGLPLPGMAGGSIPKLTLIAEVDDSVAFGKTLDNLMVTVNRELKARAAAQADAQEAANNPDGPGAPGGAPGRGRGRPAQGGDNSAPPRVAPEFKQMPGSGKDKVYTLTVPADMAKQIPAGFRPSIRLGAKHVVIALTPDAARTALEVKPSDWTVPTDLAPAFDRLAQNFMLLSVSDPRSTMPELLASLPANLQRGFNTYMSLARNPPPPGGPETPGGPGGPRGGSGGSGGGRTLVGASPSGGAGGPPGSSAYPGGSGGPSGSGAYPGQGGPPAEAGGAGNSEASAGGGLLQFNIDAAKLPKAEELRSRMFPSTFSIVIDDQEVRLVSRTSFPNLISTTSGVGVALALPAVQAARAAARNAAGLPPETPPPGLNATPAGGPPGAAPGEAPGGRRRPGAGGGGSPGPIRD